MVGGRLGKRARICRECFTPLFAIDDAERTGTIDAGFPGTDDHGELKLRKRASPARFLRCAWWGRSGGRFLVTRQRFLATTTMWACLGPHAHGYHWSAANEAVRRGSIFGHLHWANDAFHSGNAGRMCLQRCQRALVIKVGIATTTLYQLWKKIRGKSLQDFDKSKTSTNPRLRQMRE